MLVMVISTLNQFMVHVALSLEGIIINLLTLATDRCSLEGFEMSTPLTKFVDRLVGAPLEPTLNQSM